MKKILILFGAIIIAGVIAAGSFYGGMVYQRNQADAIRNNFLRSRGLNPDTGGFPGSGQSNARGAPGGFFGGGITGQVKSIDGNTITLGTPLNETVVTLTDATSIQKTSAGAMADLQPGQQVMVMGERDAQGNITAVQVLILSNGQTTPEAYP